jgi:23S rRNA (adenine2503-C2)-methyltransferase
MTPLPHIFDLTPESLADLVVSWGMPRFRAGQILKWVYERRIADPALMSDLSKAHRDLLPQRLRFTTLQPIGHQLATDGTQKLLLHVPSPADPPSSSPPPEPVLSLPLHPDAASPADLNRSVECVMIPSENPGGTPRRTACISSQIGCPVGCRFCASGLGGLEDNLTAGQIVEQVWHLNRLPELRDSRGITNIVFMGMGEPLANFDHVTAAIRTLTADWAFGISARKITVSTVGVPAPIRRLADQIDLPITLALSLHAPTDDLRRQLIPWSSATTIDKIIDACRHYFTVTGREITLEYILLRNVNDQPLHAQQLAAIARSLRCNVNLIRYNEVRGLPFARPSTDAVRQFQNTLRSHGVNAHIRASRGRDIAAACGQLRHETAGETPR